MRGSWQVTPRKNVNFCQKLEYEVHTKLLIWQICKNMRPHVADVATVPRCCKWACVWLGWLRCLVGGVLQWHPLWLRLWRLVFSQHWTNLKIRPICYPVRVVPVPTRSGPQVSNQGYPGLFQFIYWYPWLTPDIQSYPVFRWTVEVWRGVRRPAAAARQPGLEMNETNGMSTSEGISQDNSA